MALIHNTLFHIHCSPVMSMSVFMFPPPPHTISHQTSSSAAIPYHWIHTDVASNSTTHPYIRAPSTSNDFHHVMTLQQIFSSFNSHPPMYSNSYIHIHIHIHQQHHTSCHHHTHIQLHFCICLSLSYQSCVCTIAAAADLSSISASITGLFVCIPLMCTCSSLVQLDSI